MTVIKTSLAYGSSIVVNPPGVVTSNLLLTSRGCYIYNRYLQIFTTELLVLIVVCVKLLEFI